MLWCTYAIVGNLAKYFNKMAGFTFTPTDGDGCFHLRKESFLHDGLEFTIVDYKVGTWSNNGQVVNKNNGNSIRLVTSVSDADDDLLNINFFIGKNVVLYSDTGRAQIHYYFKEHKELLKFLEEKIGRRSDDPNTLVGSAKEVAEKVVKDFFGDKKLVVKELQDVFFKTIKDGVERLDKPFSPVYEVSFKE